MHKSALVVGGGVAGLQASLDLAEAGVAVTIVETQAILGGKMATLLSHDPQCLHSSNGIRVPGLHELEKYPNIEILPLAELSAIEARPEGYSVQIRQRSRIVTDACVMCNKCRQVCPVIVPNEYEAGLTYRKAIHSPYTGSVPGGYLVDTDHCLNAPPNYIPCQRCVDVCESHCIDFTGATQQSLTRDFGAIIITVGFDTHNSKQIDALGYGRCPDVLNAFELESLLSPVGPSGGFAERPSNKQAPNRMLFVLTDPSPFCWSYIAAQCTRLREQEVLDITIMYTGGDTQSLIRNEHFAHGPHDTKLVPARVKLVHSTEDGMLSVRYLPLGNATAITEAFDMVVLGADIEPARSIHNLAELLGVAVTDAGYVAVHGGGHPVTTNRPGIFAAGCATAPKDVSLTLKEAKAAVREALRRLGVAIPSSIYEHDHDDEATAESAQQQPPQTTIQQYETLVQRLIALGGGEK